MKASIIHHELHFKQPAGTSRGVLKSKDTWFLKVSEGSRIGWGEIALFKGLSADDNPNFQNELQNVLHQINNGATLTELIAKYKEWPSIRFGLEQAALSIRGENCFELYPSRFTNGTSSIPINGLIWMGDYGFMKAQIEEKLNAGFDCIKLKIGAIDFTKELSLLELIRKDFSSKQVEIRVDANGAFSADNAAQKLDELSNFNIHSIEQPIRQGQLKKMKTLCENPSVKIALDEELIGVNNYKDKLHLLEYIQPQYIILKPTLVGGFASCDEWIEIANSLKIGWWITSALESNIGLNAIAQYVSIKNTTMYQGLGTGGLFTNNVDSPLKIGKGCLHYDQQSGWGLSVLKHD